MDFGLAGLYPLRPGLNVNPRNDYTFASADAAVGQPVPRAILLVGVGYRLGK